MLYVNILVVIILKFIKEFLCGIDLVYLVFIKFKVLVLLFLENCYK